MVIKRLGTHAIDFEIGNYNFLLQGHLMSAKQRPYNVMKKYY